MEHSMAFGGACCIISFSSNFRTFGDKQTVSPKSIKRTQNMVAVGWKMMNERKEITKKSNENVEIVVLSNENIGLPPCWLEQRERTSFRFE